jgi:folate-binding protein YgfZ
MPAAPDASTATTPTPTTASPTATADALASGIALRWWQVTTFLEVAGPDAATLLDGLCTQAVERIEPGTARLGLFLDAKARIIAPAVLHRVADRAWLDPRSGEQADASTLLLELLPDGVEPLRAHLAKYRLRARVTIEPRELGTIALVGAGTDALDAAALPGDDGSWTRVHDEARTTLAFIGDDAACAALVATLPESIGATVADPDAMESDRIDAGIASLHDLLAGRMPAEVGGMQRAVALDAGCYLGQEPVARLHYRGHANRTLRRLESSDVVTPSSAEDALQLRRDDDDDTARAAGQLTTWARRPDGSTTALAMLRRELERDQHVRLAVGDVRLRIIDSPDG